MNHFDIAIVGGGLSGLIRADLLSENSNRNLKIAILDPNPSKMKEKTFASWVLKSDDPHRYSHLVSHRWEKIHLTDLNGERIERDLQNHCYEVIPGTSLFQHLKDRIFADSRFIWIESSVRSISEDSSSGTFRLELDSDETITADQVFNSIVNTSNLLYQSFVGVEIRTEDPCFHPSSVHLMDFSVPQKGEVRFVYTLPFSEHHALIEYTAFSKQKPEDSDLDECLMELIKKDFKERSYQIIRKESGAIPMDDELEPRFGPSFHFSKLESMGAAANRIKPSTGYSFSRNLSVFSKTQQSTFRSLRFSFYDSLLLKVVQKQGGRAADVFIQLFRNNRVDTVFRFLSEKTSFVEELGILLRLPKLPFISQLMLSRPFFFIVFIALIFQLLDLQWALWLFPILGLITVGMAHGSLDVVLSQTENRFVFITGYLVRMMIALLAWVLFPPLALILFLIQSADHFGEAQWIRLLRRPGNGNSVRVRSWIWGLFASLFGVLFHWKESIPYLEALLEPMQSLNGLTVDSAKLISFGLLVLGIWSSQSLDRYHRRVYGSEGTGLISTVALAFSLMILPMIPGFLCFFAFWHGWDTLKVQIKIQRWEMKEYVRQAAPYTLLAYGMLFAFMAFFKDDLNLSMIVKILVVAISALTAAHAPAMKRFLFFRDPKVANPKSSLESPSKSQ